mmetsp:Transcript_126162/g.251997  ORF Transcript_126162/g.251997 Transcript_126162/m.251997 type:complete len:84 (-) Transcript_126162:11-262(-)
MLHGSGQLSPSAPESLRIPAIHDVEAQMHSGELVPYLGAPRVESGVGYGMACGLGLLQVSVGTKPLAHKPMELPVKVAIDKVP